MVQYLHFRILKFPLIPCSAQSSTLGHHLARLSRFLRRLGESRVVKELRAEATHLTLGREIWMEKHYPLVN
jgi:hypothetical protein